MTLTFQASTKKPSGVIYVVGGDDIDSFLANLTALYDGDLSAAEELLKDMAAALSPMATAVATANAGLGGTQSIAQGSYGGPGGAQGRVSNTPTVLSVPFSEKDAAKALGATWDKNIPPRGAWVVPAGLQLGSFERWLPPGS